MPIRTPGGGFMGRCMELMLYPNAALKATLIAMEAAGTEIENTLVRLTWANNYECQLAANDSIPDGIVFSWEHDVTYGYKLSVRLFHAATQNSQHFTPQAIVTIPYSGTIALQDSIIINGSDGKAVDDGTTGGWGAVISKDTVNATVDVLC